MEAASWLSRDEVVFGRLQAFHRERVETLAANPNPLSAEHKGILIVHLVPQKCVEARVRIDAAKLNEHSGRLAPLGELGSRVRFNVDGLLKYDHHEKCRAYCQLYRDGRIESVMSDAAYAVNPHHPEGRQALRDIICERAVRDLLRSYPTFAQGLGLEPPIWMFSALIDCRGVRILANRDWSDLSEHSIDRSPAYLPEVEIGTLDVEIDSLLRPWCDSLWQASGVERSFNFDDQGKWRQRR